MRSRAESARKCGPSAWFSPFPAGFLRHPVHWLALGFGTGCAKSAPGTFGTLAGVLVYGILPSDLAVEAYVFVTAVMFAAGIGLCAKTAADLNVHDHPAIVWDEIVGFLITMTSSSHGWWWIVTGFIVFRLFDIIKPWPIHWLDRRVHGGLGIMLDDAVAGIFGCAVLHALAALVTKLP